MMNEQQLQDLCVGWFQEAIWRFVHGTDIALDGAKPERTDYRQVILRERLLATARDSLFFRLRSGELQVPFPGFSAEISR